MEELIKFAFEPINIVYTIFLLLSIIYMLSVVVGVMDISTIDFDVDIDADLDIDTDVDVEGNIGIFAGALSFFNIGKIPFMIIFSIASLCMWVIAILLNHYIGGSILFSICTFLPIVMVSLIITKIVTMPLVPVFENMNEGVEPINYVGETGELLLSASKESKGQAEINIEGDVHRIMVKLDEDNKVDSLPKGSKIVVVGTDKSKEFYWIEKNSL